jgi:hypothetical protein
MGAWYHVSEKDLGDTVILTAKVPKTAPADLEDVTTARVCFAPSISQCLYAIHSYKTNLISEVIKTYLHTTPQSCINPTVYFTDAELVKPDDASDYSITEEHWSLTDIAVRRLGYVDLYHLLMKKNLRLTQKSCTVPKRYISVIWAAIQSNHTLVKEG